MLISFFLTICHIYPQIHFGQECWNLGRSTGTGRNSRAFGKLRNRGAFCTDLSSVMENCGCSDRNRTEFKTLSNYTNFILFYNNSMCPFFSLLRDLYHLPSPVCLSLSQILWVYTFPPTYHNHGFKNQIRLFSGSLTVPVFKTMIITKLFEK